ncbi:toll-like receptor 13 [Xyrauchen texanus]|uniref:toll-like receptor 13 n=1 Tax=Xyrauchen texanus TaxID=154827 RepID=UPI0022418E1C|nr:toll-like receptor 13 [Xyrauchen texanus]
MESLKTIVLYIALCGSFSAVTSFSLNNCTITNSRYDINLKVLCYKMGFFSVPPQIPSNTQILDVSFNAFAQIKIGDYQNLLNLRDLNVSNNKIVWIQEGAFDCLSNLTNLNLGNNKLKGVSSGMLRSLTNLLVLRLDGNNIEEIDESAFSTLQHLKVLNLTNNHLRYIGRVKPVLASPALEELYIGGNHFDVFNSTEMSTKPLSLKKLDFSNNPLGTFHLTDNIFPTLNHFDLSFCGQNGTMTWNVTEQTYFTSVKTLYFMDVHISHQSVAIVLQSFKKFLYKIRLNRNVKLVNKTELLLNTCSPALRVVRLNANKITDLSDRIFEPCSNLTELDLGENNIFQLSPGTFSRFRQLQILRLQINKLTNVTNSFQMLTTLEFIDLSRNSIKLNCGDFGNLTQLKILYLYDNKISHISPCLFKDLKRLEVLKLGTNDLLMIGDAFKNGPHSLKDLQLSFNKLSKIGKGSFSNVSQLNNLEIQDNQISEIEANAFSGLEKLTSLSLSSNKITARTFRHPNVFSGMPNLESLDLYANSILFTDNTLKYPPFTDLKLLRVLTIHSQRRGFGKVPSNLLHGLSSLEMFYGGNMNLNHLHPDTFKFSPKLWFLDLSKNALSDDNAIPSELFHSISGLTKLIISRTQLRSLNFLLNANLSRLSTLRASGNEIDGINKTLIETLPRLKVLDLQKNTFTCDCNNAFFIDWAMKNNRTQVFYFNKYKCSYPPALRGISLSVFNTDSCTVNYDIICFLCSSLLIIVTLLLSFVWHFLRFQLVYAYYLILAFLYDSKKKQMLQQHAFQYDAFVSYNTQDELWVMEELLPKLEGEQGWRLCLHHRDFEPGRPIMDNIIDGIYSSRKTICLITRNYLKSNWCSSEVQLASFRLFDEQKDVLILVFLEDIPTHQLSPYYRMQKLVRKRTYLRWPKPGEDSRIFWQKLRMALENKQKPNSECTILLG